MCILCVSVRFMHARSVCICSVYVHECIYFFSLYFCVCMHDAKILAGGCSEDTDGCSEGYASDCRK
jgi:hypothetical protein